MEASQYEGSSWSAIFVMYSRVRDEAIINSASSKRLNDSDELGSRKQKATEMP